MYVVGRLVLFVLNTYFELKIHRQVITQSKN